MAPLPAILSARKTSTPRRGLLHLELSKNEFTPHCRRRSGIRWHNVQCRDVRYDQHADLTTTFIEKLRMLWVVQKLVRIVHRQIGQRRADEYRRIVFRDKPDHVAIRSNFLPSGTHQFLL